MILELTFVNRWQLRLVLEVPMVMMHACQDINGYLA